MNLGQGDQAMSMYHSKKGLVLKLSCLYLSGHGSSEDNEFDCFMECLAFDNCRYYTWFGQYPIDGVYNDECQFFSSCDMLIPDDLGTITGFIDLDV